MMLLILSRLIRLEGVPMYAEVVFTRLHSTEIKRAAGTDLRAPIKEERLLPAITSLSQHYSSCRNVGSSIRTRMLRSLYRLPRVLSLRVSIADMPSPPGESLHIVHIRVASCIQDTVYYLSQTPPARPGRQHGRALITLCTSAAYQLGLNVQRLSSLLNLISCNWIILLQCNL